MEKEKKELTELIEKMKLELETNKDKEELEKERQEKLNELRIKDEQNKRNRKALITDNKSIKD